MLANDSRIQNTLDTAPSLTPMVAYEAEFASGRRKQGISMEITDIDVYCGRDKRSNTHPGNRKFRDVINCYRERYQTASLREQKTRITTEIIDLVHKWGGRFMKQNQRGDWVEIDTAYAHDKVSHALRSAKDPRRPRVVVRRTSKPDELSEAEAKAFNRLLHAQEEFYEEMKRQRNSFKASVLSGFENNHAFFP